MLCDVVRFRRGCTCRGREGAVLIKRVLRITHLSFNASKKGFCVSSLKIIFIYPFIIRKCKYKCPVYINIFVIVWFLASRWGKMCARDNQGRCRHSNYISPSSPPTSTNQPTYNHKQQPQNTVYYTYYIRINWCSDLS